MMTLIIILSAMAMLALATTMALILGWANKAFHVEVDPRVAKADALLPGANCGGCGYVGCGAYAEAVALNGESVTLCGPGGQSCAEALAELMGVEVEQTWPYRAVVHCSADNDKRLQQSEYRGEQTCAAANLVANVQGCTYGCLGFGDCVRSCEYDAIHIVNGLAEVDYDKCTGCGACITVCPRHIISRVPFKAEQMLVVGCSSKDPGAEVKKVCKVGCIGCKACQKITELFQIKDNLAAMDYEKYRPEEAETMEAAINKCPMESLIYVGKPTQKDIEAVAEEPLPDRVQAKFETTVDQTDWRG